MGVVDVSDSSHIQPRQAAIALVRRESMNALIDAVRTARERAWSFVDLVRHPEHLDLLATTASAGHCPASSKRMIGIPSG
jgi:hypothetical protein